MTLIPVKTALIGCGNISSIYLENAAKWDILDLRACANRTLPRAQRQAEKFHVPQVMSIAGNRTDHQPDHPGRARRNRAGGAACRQISLQ
jgi:predicted dehydrogenase